MIFKVRTEDLKVRLVEHSFNEDMSFSHIARQCKVSDYTIWTIIHGKAQQMNCRTLKKICDFLGLQWKDYTIKGEN